MKKFLLLSMFVCLLASCTSTSQNTPVDVSVAGNTYILSEGDFGTHTLNFTNDNVVHTHNGEQTKGTYIQEGELVELVGEFDLVPGRYLIAHENSLAGAYGVIWVKQ